MNVVKDSLASYEKVLIKNYEFPLFSNDGRLMGINDKFFVLASNQCGYLNIYKNTNSLNSYTKYKVDADNSNSISYIYDMEFSPFHNNILACGNDNIVFLIKMNESNNGIFFNSSRYQKHKKKVNFLNFNPIVNNLMCSCTSYGEVHVWDSQVSKTIAEFNVPSTPNVVSWDTNGSLIGISAKNKNFYIHDPRANKSVCNVQISEVTNNSKFAWVDDNQVVTIGWDKLSRRTISLFDIRNKSIVCQKLLDSYTSSTTPYVDPELKLIYTIGNGDSYIRAFDYSNGKIENIQNHLLSKSNNTSIVLKRRYLDKQHNEIDRFIIYTKEKNISYVSFSLRNKNLDTLRAYPNENLSKPQLSVADWVKGQNVKLIPQKVYTTQTSKDENKYPSESIRILPKKDEFVYNNNINNSNDYSEPNSEKYNVKITVNSKRTSSGNIGSNKQRQQFSQQNPSLPQENFISQEEKCKNLMDENKNLKTSIQQMSNKLENLNKNYTKSVNYISEL